MAKVSFVGFQEKVEIPEGFELLLIDEEIGTNADKDRLFSLLSEPEQISSWFYKVTAFDSRPGGKLDFVNAAGASDQAVCTSFVLGKEVSFVADAFGNFSARVIKGKSENSIQLRFSLLTDQGKAKSKEILGLIDRLRQQL